jgi:hypothetical protein
MLRPNQPLSALALASADVSPVDPPVQHKPGPAFHPPRCETESASHLQQRKNMNLQAAGIFALSIMAGFLAACGGNGSTESGSASVPVVLEVAATGSVATAAPSESAPAAKSVQAKAPSIDSSPAPTPKLAPAAAPVPEPTPAPQVTVDSGENILTSAEQRQPCESNPNAAQGSACAQ